MRKIDIRNLDHTRALMESLRSSPLLVDDLPEAACFDRGGFSEGVVVPELNYSQKLGHLYEDALEYLLRHSDEIHLLGKGIQIFNEEKETIGELDYLLEDLKTGEFIHLELAVKFYLVRIDDGVASFPGPDPRDNWLNKLENLRQRQLKLARRSEAAVFLLERYGVSEVTPEQLIYGKIFDHYLAEGRPNPPAMNAACQRGSWKYLSEWCKGSSGQEVTIIPKHLWPVNVEKLYPKLGAVSREEFIMEADQRCTMIWDEEARDTQFIAPDNWS